MDRTIERTEETSQFVTRTPGMIAMAEMQRWVDSRFHCMMGPPRAYFEIPFCDPGLPRNALRLVYQTLHWVADPVQFNTDPRALVETLVERMRVSLETCNSTFDPETKPLLFWRKTPELNKHEATGLAYIRCRLVVPGYSFPDAFEEGSIPQRLEAPRIARV